MVIIETLARRMKLGEDGSDYDLWSSFAHFLYHDILCWSKHVWKQSTIKTPDYLLQMILEIHPEGVRLVLEMRASSDVNK